MPTFPSARPRDFVLLTALLLACAVPLIVLRHSAWLAAPAIQFALGAVIAGLMIAWAAAGRVGPTTALESKAAPAPWRSLVGAMLLFVLTVLTYVIPLLQGWWAGVDEFAKFEPAGGQAWSHVWDGVDGRALTGLVSLIPRTLTPHRIEGFVILGIVLCYVNALLLWGILDRLFPGGSLLGPAAAALFVSSTAEPLRFCVLWAANGYSMALAWYLLALWLLLISAADGRRGLLLASCTALGAGLLTLEGLFPLALLGPVLLWLVRTPRGRLLLWSWAWLGTVGVLAVRLLLHLMRKGAGSYQLHQASRAYGRPDVLLANLVRHLRPLADYVTVPTGLASWWPYALLTAVVTAGLLLLLIRGGESAPRRRPLVVGLIVGSMALLLALSPFLHLLQLRTQFLAAPVHATLVGLGLCLLGSLIPWRIGRALALAAVVALVARSPVASFAQQQANDWKGRFENTVHVLDQVHAVSPRFAPDTVLVLYLDDPSTSPLGLTYSVNNLAQGILGTPLLQANYDDSVSGAVSFGPTGIVQKKLGFTCRYEQMVLYRLQSDCTVSLLRQLPAGVVSTDSGADRYDPLARLRPGPIDPLPFMRYPVWSAPVAEVLDVRAGLLFGSGWGELICEEGDAFRLVEKQAEVVVNPVGVGGDGIRLLVEADPPSPDGAELQLLDEAGDVVAADVVAGRQEVRLCPALSSDRAHLLVLRMRGRGPDAAPLPFRVLVSGRGAEAAARQRFRTDVFDRECRPRHGWTPCRRDEGTPMRWMREGAELVVGRRARDEVFLDLSPTVGFADRRGRLRVTDGAGRVLADAEVLGRSEIAVPLPSDLPSDSVLTLHGDAQSPPDAPLFRVLGVSWRRQRAEVPLEGVRLGRNWYGVEQASEEPVRAAANEAELVVLAGGRAEVLLDIGPFNQARAKKGHQLHVESVGGRTLTSVELDQRTRLRVPLPSDTPSGTTLRLRVEAGAKSAPSQPPVPVLKLYGCQVGTLGPR